MTYSRIYSKCKEEIAPLQALNDEQFLAIVNRDHIFHFLDIECVNFVPQKSKLSLSFSLNVASLSKHFFFY